ncbi:MAG: tRNA (adenosine(37)-N6)-dimethylallyltransferase MiaA [Candidatus Magasanikbacteria bacterium]|nr:tRNA (adenosine(37)-N6)-dimethylallyltransferase MiaA [Candidatus Magasanikbacteria bacterium]
MRKEHAQLPKVIILLGPTASGKTWLGLRLAKKFNGEIISADSRQIYKKMTIGTAKPVGEWKWNGLRKTYFVDGIAHHLVDFVDPGKTFTVAEFRDKAIKYIKMIHSAGRVPIVVGGTGLYIQALVDNLQIPRVPASKKLRKSFEDKTLGELLAWLGNLDPDAVASVDVKNKRRIIRALEVCIMSGEKFSAQREKGHRLFDFLQVGIHIPREELYARIHHRIDEMIGRGLLDEVADLVRQKYSWELPSMSGIGYRQFRQVIETGIGLEQAIEQFKRDTRHYAKRQMTWFKRDNTIQWFVDEDDMMKVVEEFLHV